MKNNLTTIIPSMNCLSGPVKGDADNYETCYGMCILPSFMDLFDNFATPVLNIRAEIGSKLLNQKD